MSGRKIAGLLAEFESGEDEPPAVILGLGINVNSSQGDLPQEAALTAGSLLIATGKKHDRTQVLAGVLWGLEREYLKLEQGRWRETLDDYRKICVTIGSDVVVTQAGEETPGRAVGVDEIGRLEVRTETGGVIQVSAGEVTLAKS